jgi:hypothetical protein
MWFSGAIPWAIKMGADKETAKIVCSEHGLEAPSFAPFAHEGNFMDINGSTYARCEGMEFVDNGSYYQNVVRYYRID